MRMAHDIDQLQALATPDPNWHLINQQLDIDVFLKLALKDIGIDIDADVSLAKENHDRYQLMLQLQLILQYCMHMRAQLQYVRAYVRMCMRSLSRRLRYIFEFELVLNDPNLTVTDPELALRMQLFMNCKIKNNIAIGIQFEFMIISWLIFILSTISMSKVTHSTSTSKYFNHIYIYNSFDHI